MRLGRAQPASATKTHAYLRPPTVILPPPTLREQTVKVTLAAQHRRITEKRRMPLQGFAGSKTAQTGFKVETWGWSHRLLGPRPPEAIIAGPTQRMQTVGVYCQAVQTRCQMHRRVPPVWLEPTTTKTAGAGSQTWGSFMGLGPQPPRVILPLPNQKQQTITVWELSLAERRRLLQAIKTKSTLLPPATLQRPPPAAPLLRVFAPPVKRSRVGGFHILGPPVLVFAPLAPPIDVRLAAARRPRPTSELRPPVVVGSAAPPTLGQQTIATNWVRRPPLRGTMRALGPPVVISAATTVAPVETEVRVTLARVRPPSRATHYRLAPPTVVTPATVTPPLAPITVHCVRRPPQRGTLRVLGAPVVIGPAAAANPPVETTLTVSLVPRRQDWRRYVLHILFSPAIVNPPVPVETTSLVAFAPRPKQTRLGRTGHYRLAPPAVVAPRTPPTQAQQTVTVVRPATRMRPRRFTDGVIRPPTVVTPFTPPSGSGNDGFLTVMGCGT